MTRFYNRFEVAVVALKLDGGKLEQQRAERLWFVVHDPPAPCLRRIAVAVNPGDVPSEGLCPRAPRRPYNRSRHHLENSAAVLG